MMWGQKLWGGCELARRLLHHLSPTPVGEKPVHDENCFGIKLPNGIKSITSPKSSRKQFRKP